MERKIDILEEDFKELRKILHDVRSPLITIRGFAEILKLKLAHETGDEESTYFDKIITNVDKMADRLDELHAKVKSMQDKNNNRQ